MNPLHVFEQNCPESQRGGKLDEFVVLPPVAQSIARWLANRLLNAGERGHLQPDRSPFRMKIQNFNLLCAYNVDFRLPLIKLDRADDADDFP